MWNKVKSGATNAANWVTSNQDRIVQATNTLFPGGSDASQYDDYDDYDSRPYIGPGTETPTPPPAEKSSIGDFVKNNALMLGIGAVGVGAAIYFMTQKKKSGK